MPKYSIEEANWLVETIRKQRGWSYRDLAEELGKELGWKGTPESWSRFLRFFRTGERTSYPVYKQLIRLSKKPPTPPPTPPPKVKIEVHPYLAEEETREFFYNIGKHLPRITKGTAPHRKMQGEPVQLTLADFMNFKEEKKKIIENFTDWLVNTAEERLQRAYRSTKPLKGKSKIKMRFEEISSITEEEEVEEAINELNRVEEGYRPKVFTIAERKAETMEDLSRIIKETYGRLTAFFEEREREKRTLKPGESITYTREYLKGLGLSPEEVERYREVKG